MKRNRILLIVVLVLGLLMAAMPSMAQEEAGSVFGVEFDPVLIVVVGCVFGLLLIGLLFVLWEAVNRLGVSVPEQSFMTATTAIVDTVQKLLTDLQVGAQKTDTPFDDLALEIGRMPLDKLIEILRAQGLVVSGNIPGDNPPSYPTG